jgi:hypothetical protein
MIINVLIFLVFPIALILFGTWADCRFHSTDDGLTSKLVGSIILMIVLVIWPMSRMTYKSLEIERDSIEKTYNNARISAGEIERAAIMNNIADLNKRIEQAKYWQTHFPLFIPKNVHDLELIQ